MYSNLEAEDKGDMVPATLQLVKPTSHQNPTSPVAATLYTGIAILLILSLFILFTYRKWVLIECQILASSKALFFLFQLVLTEFKNA